MLQYAHNFMQVYMSKSYQGVLPVANQSDLHPGFWMLLIFPHE